MSQTEAVARWLTENKIALALSARGSNRLLTVCASKPDQLAMAHLDVPACSGLAATPTYLDVGMRNGIWRLSAIEREREPDDRKHCLYHLTRIHVTGRIEIHEIAHVADGRPIFVNTRFSCLATVADHGSFSPIWHPPFAEDHNGEDHCHLNGLAVADGRPIWATALAATGEPQGWRQHRRDGGVLIHVPSGSVRVEGLSMPHSPRIWDEKVWLLNSGTGEFGEVDGAAGTFRPHLRVSGFPRGLAFYGSAAIIGVSRPRAVQEFSELPIGQIIEDNSETAVCGFVIYDVSARHVVGRMTFGNIDEIQDIVVLPGHATAAFAGADDESLDRLVQFAEPTNLVHLR